MAIQICVPKEVRQDEQRVALVPDTVKRLATEDLLINIQAGAGMVLATLVTFMTPEVINSDHAGTNIMLIILAIAIGGGYAWYSGRSRPDRRPPPSPLPWAQTWPSWLFWAPLSAPSPLAAVSLPGPNWTAGSASAESCPGPAQGLGADPDTQ